MFSIGGSTNASIALGQRDYEKANRLYTVGVWFGFFVSLIFVAVMELIGPALCGFLGHNNEVITPYILDYNRPLASMQRTAALPMPTGSGPSARQTASP